MNATTEVPSPSTRQCPECKGNLCIERNRVYITLYVCPKCGIVAIDAPEESKRA